MRKLTLLLLTTMLILTACNSFKNNEDAKKELTLENVIEQLGEESFSEEGLNEHTYIADKDGYTYVMTPKEGYAKSLRLVVSIIKDNEFIVKEKETNLKIKNASLKYLFSENNLLVRTTKYSDGPLDTTYGITINEKGEVSKQIISKDIPRNQITTTFMEGLNGSYFATFEDDQGNIIDYKGEVVYSFDTSDSYPLDDRNMKVLFLDESEGKVYFRLKATAKNDFSEEDVLNKSFVFDIEKEEMIMENGDSEKIFTFPVSDAYHYKGGNNGFYVEDDSKLYFYSTENGQVQLVDEAELESPSETGDSDYTRITLDDEYLNIYRIVEDSIQKYSYSRVD